MTDAQLVALALAGDARAFGALVTRHQDLAVSVAYAATGDVGLSEDLAQEAFVVAWRRLAALTHRDRFGPWLCGIVRHVGRSERRHRSRHAPAAGSPERLDSLAAALPSPLDEAMARQALAHTWHALRALPPRYREPLVLYCRMDHSHARVAASLGISEETVRQRVSRARQKLRDEVEAVERQVRAARGPVAAGVVALVWMRSAAAARAAAGPSWLVGIAAPLAAAAAILVFIAAAITVSRARSPAADAEVSQPSPAVAAREGIAPSELTRASVELGAGAVEPVVLFDFSAAPERAAPPPRGRVVRHGPAVVNRTPSPPPPRALERPTLDIDPTFFIP